MITEKLFNIQKNLKVKKNRHSEYGGYNFFKAEDIIRELKPLLTENKLILTVNDTVELIGDRYYIKSVVTLTDVEDNGQIQAEAWSREPEEKKKFDSGQITGASSSYAKKYALSNLLALDNQADLDEIEEESVKKELQDKIALTCKNKGITYQTLSKLVTDKFNKPLNGLNLKELQETYNNINK